MEMMINNRTSTTIDMKIQFRGENRIVSIAQQADNNQTVDLYRLLKQQVAQLFQLSEQQVSSGRIQYVDDEEDMVIVDSKSELLTAIRVQREIMGQKIVKFTWIGAAQPIVTMTQQEHSEQQTEPHSAPSVDNIDITTTTAATATSSAQPKWRMRNLRERQLQKVQMKREIQALKQDMRQLKREQKQKSLVLKSLRTGGDSNSCGGGTTITAITNTTTAKTAPVRLAEHKMEKMKKRMQLKMEKQMDREAKRIFKLNSRAITQSLKRGEFPTHITSLVIDAETMVKNIRKLQLKSEDEYGIEHLCQTLIHLLAKLTEQCIRDNHRNLKMKILVPTPEFASVMERWIQMEPSSAVLNTDNVQIVSALPTYTNVSELLASVVQAMVNESSDDSAKNSILLVSKPKNVQQSVSENPNLNFVFCRRMVKYLLHLAGMLDMKSKKQKKFELKHHGRHHHHRHGIENSGGPHFVANI